MLRSAFFSLLPLPAPGDPADAARPTAGEPRQRFSVSVYNNAVRLSALRWNELVGSPDRKVHATFIRGDLAEWSHLHPEDFDGKIANDSTSWEIAVPLTSPGRWLALVDFAAKEEPNPFETNLTLKLKPRHGSLGATLLEGRAAFDVSERSAAAPPEPAEAPKLAPSGASRFRGVVINSTDIFIDPIKIDDLSSERPTTANAEGTFLTTFRTNPAVVNPNSCATAVLEFFTSSNGTWVPLDLTALYGQATHLISTHSSLLHASHAHAYPWPQFLDAPNQFGITFDKSLVPNACNGDAGSHGHAPNWIAPASFPGKLIAPIRFGPAGSYAVFTQAAAMIGGEKVMLAPRFVVSVGSGKESTTGAVAPLAGLSSAGVVPPPFSESQAQPQGAPVAAIVGTLIGLLVMVLLLGLGMFWYRRRRHPVAHDTAFSKSDKAAEGEYVELEAASQAVQERNVV